ncbi:glycosyltransferase family 2 protein, partial [Microbispora sp. ZYX-F-249]
LPAPLIPVYLAVWTVISITRIRDKTKLAVWFRGLREGLKGGHGQRRPMSWTTVARLTVAGRPPIV